MSNLRNYMVPYHEGLHVPCRPYDAPMSHVDFKRYPNKSCHLFLFSCHYKPCTEVASNLLSVDLRLDVRIACDGLQQKFQHAEYFACSPLISQPIFIRFSLLFSKFNKLSNDSMIQHDATNISTCP